MDSLLKAAQVAEILQVNTDTARVLMRKMRHMDISAGNGTRRELRVWEADLKAWLDSRMEESATDRKRGRKPKQGQQGLKLIPYRRVAE